MICTDKARQIRTMVDSGICENELARLYGVREDTIRRYLDFSKPKPKSKAPKILLFDIETSTVWARLWGIRKQHVGHYQVIEGKEWFTISWSAMWLHDGKIMSDCVTPKQALMRNDESVLMGIWNLINEADITIAHNAKRFDVRKLNGRFVILDLPKPGSFEIIDTLIQAQKQFAFTSHKLDYLNTLFSLRKKDPTDFDLWIKCEEGDQESLDYMLQYNQSDVIALKELYLKIRPWMTSHPNLALYVDDEEKMCTVCMSKRLTREGSYHTVASSFPEFRCNDCTSLVRSRFSETSKGKRRNLLVPIAR